MDEYNTSIKKMIETRRFKKDIIQGGPPSDYPFSPTGGDTYVNDRFPNRPMIFGYLRPEYQKRILAEARSEDELQDLCDKYIANDGIMTTVPKHHWEAVNNIYTSQGIKNKDYLAIDRSKRISPLPGSKQYKLNTEPEQLEILRQRDHEAGY